MKGVRAVVERPILEFYAQPSVMTSVGRYAPLFNELPDEVGEMVRIIQHLVVYDVVAPAFYGFRIPEHRRSEIHLRAMEKMVERLLSLDDHALSVARTVDRRLVGRCRHFMLFLIAMLRAKGVPARARGGFGSYFNPPHFEDHWVCEYWNVNQERWIFVDAQFDDVWRRELRIEHDVLDVPRDRFLLAADAWDRCRKAEADPSKFGIHFTGQRGLWFIAASLVRDLAALNKMEMLPWDVWGAQPGSDEPLDDGQLAFFDRMAALARAPDASFQELRKLYGGDRRLAVPATVFNALLNRWEAIG
jgi:Transglutaminase-like superfamily